MSHALQRIATVTGLIQQAVEELHQLTTYELSSAASVRHAKSHEEIRKLLVEARRAARAVEIALLMEQWIKKDTEQ